MALVTGGLIEVEDYNDLALEVNRLYSDNTSNLDWETSNLILDVSLTNPRDPGFARILSPRPFNGDYILVTVNDLIQRPGPDYVISYTNPSVIVFVRSLPGPADIKVYNRESHIYGWGQQASVYPISAGDPVLADEATLQAYLEANVNNLIDKVNIMEQRTGGPTTLSRIAQGDLILASDKTTIESTINTDILAGDNYFKNEVTVEEPQRNVFSRTTTWSNQITGTHRWTWSNYDDFRYFFNSGCKIRCDINLQGDFTDNQGYNNWKQVTENLGVMLFDYNNVEQVNQFDEQVDGTAPQPTGSYRMTGTFQTILRSASPPNPVDSNGDPAAFEDYEDMFVRFEARIVQPSGDLIALEVRATLDDQGLNGTVQGNFFFDAGFIVSDQITDNSATFDPTIFLPSVTTVDDFTSGDDS